MAFLLQGSSKDNNKTLYSLQWAPSFQFQTHFHTGCFQELAKLN